MPQRVSSFFAHPRLRRGLLVAGLAGAAVWFVFFDSHSLVRRAEYFADHRALAAENAALQAEIDRLEAQLADGLSDEIVETVAREQYGMRRPGETVYPLEDRRE